MYGFLRGLIAGGVVAFLAAQFIVPRRTNPPIVQAYTLEAAVEVPSDVESILTRSCSDCHSDRTRWPWYSYVAPVSWFVANHVKTGRRHLNFSEWLPSGQADATSYTKEKFQNVCKVTESRGMPLWSYTLVHRRAKLTDQDIRILCDWSPQPRTHPR